MYSIYAAFPYIALMLSLALAPLLIPQFWHRFVKYILGTILAAYKDFEERMTIIEPKLSALEMVRRASENKIGRFNKQDIRELCSTLSDSSIEAALRKLVLSGELQKEGKGKSTCYFRVK